MSLEERVEELSRRVDALSEQLKLTYAYAQTDAQASLAKCRALLEQLLPEIIRKQGLPLDKAMSLNEMILHLKNKGEVEQRIITKMHSVRAMANLGVHGGKVLPSDALNALDSVCDIVQWHFDIAPHRAAHNKRKNKIFKVFFFSVLIVIVGVWLYQSQMVQADSRQLGKEEVMEFTKAFQLSSTNNDVNNTLSYYGPEVNHYGMIKSQTEIREGLERFVDRWYHRKYFISSPIEVVELSDGKFLTTYYETFTAKKTVNEAISRGVWKNVLTIEVLNGELKITGIDGEIVRRE